MRAGQVALQVGAEIVGFGIPVGRILGQQLEDDGLERLHDSHAQQRRRQRALLHVFDGHRCRGLGGEGGLAYDHLVEHDPQRVEVASTVESLALSLLGREVRRRSQDRPDMGEVVAGPSGQGGRYPEVGHLHLAVVAHDDVAELDVAVHETGVVGAAERLGHVRRDLCGPVGTETPGGTQHVGHVAAHDVLHDDVVGALLLAPVVDADDVGVVEGGRSLRLPAEPLDEARIIGELREQDFHRHLPVERSVPGQVYVGHSAARDAAQQFVATVEYGQTLI